jgi:tryptophan synthase alpha chain
MPGNRIDDAFGRLREHRQAAFVAYVCAGDPSLGATRDLVLGLDSAGVDIVELGLPFSDPLADGIVNQLAAQRALEGGATAARTLALVREIRESSEIPLVLFTYLNPVYAYGFDRFHADAAAAGVDGILLLDLPPDEAVANPELAGSHGVKQIRLIAPTTPPSRMRELASRAEGFVYYVSREGVTGAQSTLAEGIAENVGIIRSASRVPVCVGFGISTPEQAAAVARSADGVVVGSAIVRIIEANAGGSDLVARVTGFVRPLVEAVKSA